MLPFTLKTVEERVLPLHLHNNENSCLDVDVFTELYTLQSDSVLQNVIQTDTQNQNLNIVRRVYEATYQAFISFLTEESVSNTFLPTDVLSQFPNQRYFLILSVPRIYELYEVLQSNPDIIWMNQGQTLFEFGGVEIILSAKHHLLDNTAFLVSSGKYTVFIRQENVGDKTRFYRSDFFDLIGNAPPPILFNAQDVIDTVQNEITHREPTSEIEQVMLNPSESETEEDGSDNLIECPVCDGELRRIKESSFCLECDWDNLPTLKRYTRTQ